MRFHDFIEKLISHIRCPGRDQCSNCPYSIEDHDYLGCELHIK